MSFKLSFGLNFPLEFVKKAFNKKDNFLKIHFYSQSRDISLKLKDKNQFTYVDKDLFITNNLYIIEETEFSFKYIICVEKINNNKISFPFYYYCSYYKNSFDNTTKCFFYWTIYNKNNYYSYDFNKCVWLINKYFSFFNREVGNKICINKFEENIRNIIGFFVVYKSIMIKSTINNYLNLLFNPKMDIKII